MLHIDLTGNMIYNPHMRRQSARVLVVAAVAVLGWWLTPVAAQNAADVRPLVVAGDVAKPLSLGPAELKALPRARVEVKAEDGSVRRYEGVAASELMKLAGVTLGQMRGDTTSSYVVATAADGYQVVFALAELDPAFTASEILVADTLDGRPFPAGQGPLRLIAPKDLRATRSVRMLQRIDVVRVKR